MDQSLLIGGFGGIFWTLAYILIIRRGFIDKTYGIPIVVLCANISWEFIFAFIYPPSLAQQLVNITWFILDVLIVVTYLRFGHHDYTERLPRSSFYLTFVLLLLASFVVVLTSAQEFNDYRGMYSAFFIDMVMSVLFIVMMLQRGSIAGQSFYIAILKWLGSAAYTMVFYSYFPNSAFLVALFLLAFVFNLIYAVLLFQFIYEKGVNPLRRF